MKQNYNVAIYMRLSRDDGDDRESESIENQRDIITSFMSGHKELQLYKEYSDDGYTGTNFNRPDFKRMISDMEDGKIDCIITKDLSRFGRDHIETGYYLERLLPMKNIRYIAIGDGVDTLKAEGLQFLTFKLSFNDYYAQDISNKVKSVKRRKIEKGEYQGTIPPYGYKKDTKEKNHLVIDEEAAKVVYSIFDMYVNKDMSSTQIARTLNTNKVETPAVYLKIPTFVKKESRSPLGYLWERMQITRILGNQVYIGAVVGGKYKKVSHKVDKVKALNKKDYVVVEDKHEAIIEKDMWNKAQEKLKNFKFEKKTAYNHSLKKFVYCADCGAKATYRSRKNIKKDGTVSGEYNIYICSRAGLTQGCRAKAIRAEILEDIVKGKIVEEMNKIIYSKNEIMSIYEKAEKIARRKENSVADELSRLNGILKQKEEMIKEIYNDKLNGFILAEDFNKFYEQVIKEKEEVVCLIDKYEKKQNELKTEDRKENYLEMVRIAENLLKLQDFTEEIYSELIERIEIDRNRNVKIKLKFGIEDTIKQKKQ